MVADGPCRPLTCDVNAAKPFVAMELYVLGANGESMGLFLPEDHGNGLSEELFVLTQSFKFFYSQVYTHFCALHT